MEWLIPVRGVGPIVGEALGPYVVEARCAAGLLRGPEGAPVGGLETLPWPLPSGRFLRGCIRTVSAAEGSSSGPTCCTPSALGSATDVSLNEEA